MDVGTMVAQVTGILGQIAALTRDYDEAFRLMEGLSGALVVLTEFIQRRLGEDNKMDELAFAHLTCTLKHIENAINEIHVTMGKKWCGIPYGMWSIWGLPILQPCYGYIGSTKIIKTLTDLEHDLGGDIKFLELQMTANAVQSLSALSSTKTKITKLFLSPDAREFWSSNFGDEFTAKQSDVADALIALLRRVWDQHNDSTMSRAFQLCSFMSAELARATTVDVRTFATELSDSSMQDWILGKVSSGARTIFKPGHSGPVNCLQVKRGFLVTGGGDGTVKLFALESGIPMIRATMVGHNDPVTCVDICDAEPIIASGSVDGFIRTWSAFSGECLGIYPVSAKVRDLKCTDDKVIYACDLPSMSINCRDAASGKMLFKLSGHGGGVTSIDVSHDGRERIVSSGADRAVKDWSLGYHAPVAVFQQAHSTSVLFVLRSDSFVASVSNHDIRFYDKSNIVNGGLCVRLSNCNEARVCAACVGPECVVVVTSERYGKHANSRLLSVSPSSGGRIEYDFPVATRDGEVPTSIATSDEDVYIGTSMGAIMWYKMGQDGFKKVGEIGSASDGSDPIVFDVQTLPLLAAKGDAVLSAHPPDRLMLNGAMLQELPHPATALSKSEHAEGWVVAAGGHLYKLSDAGDLKGSFAVGGDVVSIRASDIRGKLFMDVRRKDKARSICVCESKTGICTDVVCEPCPGDNECHPELVLGDRYLVWPGHFDGTLAVLDTVNLRALDPVKYTHLEIDPLTSIASSKTWFVTLHGGMDCLMWSDVTSGPQKRFRTFDTPATSILIGPTGRLISGCTDGTIRVDSDNEDTNYIISHAIGSVNIDTIDNGIVSLGVEGSLVRHMLHF